MGSTRAGGPWRRRLWRRCLKMGFDIQAPGPGENMGAAGASLSAPCPPPGPSQGLDPRSPCHGLGAPRAAHPADGQRVHDRDAENHEPSTSASSASRLCTPPHAGARPRAVRRRPRCNPGDDDHETGTTDDTGSRSIVCADSTPVLRATVAPTPRSTPACVEYTGGACTSAPSPAHHRAASLITPTASREAVQFVLQNRVRMRFPR